nr:hypothetical protein CFP56_75650 [Quercus suber]
MSDFHSVVRPLRGPVKDWPLAVCDASSLDRSDLQECDVVFRTQVIENYLVQHNSKQRWFYLSDQTPSEAWVFMQADTTDDGLPGKTIMGSVEDAADDQVRSAA